MDGSPCDPLTRELQRKASTDSESCRASVADDSPRIAEAIFINGQALRACRAPAFGDNARNLLHGLRARLLVRLAELDKRDHSRGRRPENAQRDRGGPPGQRVRKLRTYRRIGECAADLDRPAQCKEAAVLGLASHAQLDALRAQVDLSLA